MLNWGVFVAVLVIGYGALRLLDHFVRLSVRRRRGRSVSEIEQDITLTRVRMGKLEASFLRSAAAYQQQLFADGVERVAASGTDSLDANTVAQLRAQVAAYRPSDRPEDFVSTATWPHRMSDLPFSAVTLSVPTAGVQRALTAAVRAHVSFVEPRPELAPNAGLRDRAKRVVAKGVDSTQQASRAARLVGTVPDEDWPSDLQAAGRSYIDAFGRLRDLERELEAIQPSRRARSKVRSQSAPKKASS